VASFLELHTLQMRKAGSDSTGSGGAVSGGGAMLGVGTGSVGGV